MNTYVKNTDIQIWTHHTVLTGPVRVALTESDSGARWNERIGLRGQRGRLLLPNHPAAANAYRRMRYCKDSVGKQFVSVLSGLRAKRTVSTLWVWRIQGGKKKWPIALFGHLESKHGDRYCERSTKKEVCMSRFDSQFFWNERPQVIVEFE